MESEPKLLGNAGVSRRQLLARSAVAAGVVWAAPVVRTASAYALTSAGTSRPCTQFYVAGLTLTGNFFPKYPYGFYTGYNGSDSGNDNRPGQGAAIAGAPTLRSPSASESSEHSSSKRGDTSPKKKHGRDYGRYFDDHEGRDHGRYIVPKLIEEWVRQNPNVPLLEPDVYPQITQTGAQGWAVLLPEVTGPNAAARQPRFIIGYAWQGSHYAYGYVDPRPANPALAGRRILFPSPVGREPGAGDDGHDDGHGNGHGKGHGTTTTSSTSSTSSTTSSTTVAPTTTTTGRSGEPSFGPPPSSTTSSTSTTTSTTTTTTLPQPTPTSSTTTTTTSSTTTTTSSTTTTTRPPVTTTTTRPGNGWGRDGERGNGWGRDGERGEGWGRDGERGEGWRGTTTTTRPPVTTTTTRPPVTTTTVPRSATTTTTTTTLPRGGGSTTTTTTTSPGGTTTTTTDPFAQWWIAAHSGNGSGREGDTGPSRPGNGGGSGKGKGATSGEGRKVGFLDTGVGPAGPAGPGALSPSDNRRFASYFGDDEGEHDGGSVRGAPIKGVILIYCKP